MNNMRADYEALTNGCGFVELKDWSTVTMTGEDRLSFLHNMCTADIRSLSIGESCEAFCTDVQGKIVAHIFVIAREDRLELLTVPEQAESLISHLDRYIIREDATLLDKTRDFSWLFVGNRESAIVLSEVGITCCNIAGLTGGLMGVVDGQMQDAQSLLCDACCQEAWEAVRIETGLSLFGVDFDSTNLPQEVNRNAQAINFNKGCYLGQETIARIDALGHVNKKVVLLKFEGETAPTVGLELSVGDKSVGRVTSSCWSPRFNAPLALAMVRRGANELGSQLASDYGNSIVISAAEKEH